MGVKGFVDVEDVVVGTVTDGVDGDGEAIGGGLGGFFHHLFFVGDNNAKVGWFVFVGGKHGGSAGAECAVGKDLNAADANPLVAKAGLETNANGVFESIDGNIFDEAEAEFVVLVQLLQGLEAGTAVKVMNTC